MQTQSLKGTLLLSALFTLVVVGFVSITSSDDFSAGSFLVNALVIFVIVFTTMRLTNRVTSFMVNRFAPHAPRDREASSPPPEPSSARPEHAQRRRSRRRPRGRRRPGE